MAAYYIRLKGKVWGPFSLDQLRGMQGQGRLSAFHEISQDRAMWMPVSSIPELMPPTVEFIEQPPPPVVAPVASPFGNSEHDLDFRDPRDFRRRQRDDDDERYDRQRAPKGTGNRGNGTMALVLGLVSIFVFPILGIVAIIVGNQALREDPNDGNAKAGLVLGWISTACVILAIVVVAAIVVMIAAATPQRF